MNLRFPQVFRVAMALAVSCCGCGEDKVLDTIPPAQVTDLQATALENGVRLTWTAVGDDGIEGTPRTYHLSYSTTALSGDAWNSATTLNQSIIPFTAGTQETVAVLSLSPVTRYYFAVRATDEVPQSGQWSNVASITTRFYPGQFTADENTIALYHCDETGGTDLVDASGHDNTGVISGPSRTAGRFGGGLQFDGIDDFVRIPRSSSLDQLPPQMTIEAWVNLNRIGREMICNKALTAGSECWPWLFMWNNTSLLALVTGCTGDVHGGALTTGEWHYVSLVYSFTGITGPDTQLSPDGPADPQLATGRLYVDGVLVAEQIGMETRYSVLGADIYLGAAYHYANAGNHLQDFFSGAMDEVRISKVARVINLP